METSPYVLSLLGRAELRDPEGAVVSLRTRKALLLLAVLALSADGVRRMEAGAAVWEDSDDKSVREGLRTALSGLRKVLPPDAIRTEGDVLALRPGAVSAPMPEEDGGEFMPGFEQEWAVGRRLGLRARFVAHALGRARQARSLEWAERACAADPLSAEAVALRMELLREAGRTPEATVHADAFRARSLRELGAAAEIGLPAPEPPSAHPLVAAALWSLDRDPAEACALMAGTQAQWLTLPNATALSIHRRVLAAATRPTRERRLVEAGLLYLTMQEGRLGDRLEEAGAAYREAVDLDEGPTALRLGETLAYAFLSRGDSGSALRHAREGAALAVRLRDRAAEAQAQMTLGIVEFHAGGIEASHRRVKATVRLAEAHGTATQIGTFRSAQLASWIFQGRLDRAAKRLEPWTREMRALGGERQNVWALNLEALLYERLGDLEASRAAYERFRAAAPDAGQSAVNMAEDGLLRVCCRLQEYDEAAAALARAAVNRRSLGVVRSRTERALAARAVRRLRDRLSSHDLAAAFRRAEIAL